MAMEVEETQQSPVPSGAGPKAGVRASTPRSLLRDLRNTLPSPGASRPRAENLQRSKSMLRGKSIRRVETPRLAIKKLVQPPSGEKRPEGSAPPTAPETPEQGRRSEDPKTPWTEVVNARGAEPLTPWTDKVNARAAALTAEDMARHYPHALSKRMDALSQSPGVARRLGGLFSSPSEDVGAADVADDSSAAGGPELVPDAVQWTPSHNASPCDTAAASRKRKIAALFLVTLPVAVVVAMAWYLGEVQGLRHGPVPV